MNFKEAMIEATRRAAADHEDIDIWFDRDLPSPDWRNCYRVCRYIDRPAHGRRACTVHPDGTVSTPAPQGRAGEARPTPPVRTRAAAPRKQADFFDCTTVPYVDEPYTDYQAVARLAQHCAVVLTKLDAPHVWNWTGIEEDWHDKPSTLQDENGFKIELRYSTSKKRVTASADFGKLVRHRGRDDDPCTATYSPTRPARVIAADVLRRVIEPGRVLYAGYVADEEKRLAKVNRAHAMQDQILAASRGAFESARNDGPDDADLHLYLNRGGSLHCHGHISTWSNSVTLERLEIPFDLMLRLAAMIADHLEAHRAAALAQEDDAE